MSINQQGKEGFKHRVVNRLVPIKTLDATRMRQTLAGNYLNVICGGIAPGRQSMYTEEDDGGKNASL
jgi:hypothetical protein